MSHTATDSCRRDALLSTQILQICLHRWAWKSSDKAAATPERLFIWALETYFTGLGSRWAAASRQGGKQSGEERKIKERKSGGSEPVRDAAPRASHRRQHRSESTPGQAPAPLCPRSPERGRPRAHLQRTNREKNPNGGSSVRTAPAALPPPAAAPVAAALVLGGGGRGKLCLVICSGDNKRLLFSN